MRWPSAPLNQVLTRVSRPVPLLPGKTYRLLGAHWYAKGLYVKEEKDGSEIRATTLYEVEPGDFVYNRLFAWKGAFAVVAESEGGCFVSNEFPCFRVNARLADPRWIHLCFSREQTWTEALDRSTGGTPTSRNRLKEDRLLAMQVPLPSLPEQRRIVERIADLVARIEEAQKLRREAQQSTRALLQARFGQIIGGARWMPLSELAPLQRRSVQVVPDEYYAELGIKSFGRGTFHKPELLGFELGDKRVFKIEPGDLLFNIVFAWEGAVAVAQPHDSGRIGSHRFLTCVAKSGLATAEFLRFYFLTEGGLEQLRTASPGGAGRNRTLGLDALGRISAPVPDYAHQLGFDKLQDQFSNVASLRAEADQKLAALVSSVLAQVFK